MTWNLVITRQLTAAHRSLVDSGIPEVRLEVGLLEHVAALRRTEGRYAILRDPAFLAAFQERIRSATADLDRLDSLLSTPVERDLLHEARMCLDEYRQMLDMGAPLAAGAVHPATELEEILDRLYQASKTEVELHQAALESMAERTRALGLGALAAAILIGLGLGAFAVVRVARPLHRLRTATQAVAAREFSEPLEVSGPSEIRDLTGAFNRMAARLGEIDRLKDEFFTGISHDLRTPLAAIRWSADLLHTGALGSLTAKQMRLAETIQSSSRRLLTLVGQIVELGRLRAGRLQLDLRPTDIRRVIDEALDEVRPLAELGGLHLEVDAPESLPRVAADGERVQQIVMNLLANAVRFTPHRRTRRGQRERGVRRGPRPGDRHRRRHSRRSGPQDLRSLRAGAPRPRRKRRRAHRGARPRRGARGASVGRVGGGQGERVHLHPARCVAGRLERAGMKVWRVLPGSSC